MGWTVALDFGTTATAAAVGGDGGPVSPLMLSDGNSTVSSSVFVDGGQVLVGAEADNTAEMRLDAYEPTPKRQVAQASVMLGGRELRPAQLIGAVLAPVLGEALRQHNQAPPTAVVLTHPVSWRATRRRVLSEALTHAAAGLGVQLPDPVFLAEPIAAAQWHAQQNPPAEGQCLAVYDLGGGTFDATVLRRTATGFEPIATGGIDPLGGFDFDQLLLDHLGERYIAAADAGLWRELSDPQQPDPTLARQRRQLQQHVRMLKVALTTHTNKSVRLTGVPDPKIVTRQDYEGLIRDKVDATLAELQDTIADAGLDPHELAAVYRIGGAARTPLVGDTLKQLHLDIKTEDHPKLVVAQGAAITTDRRPPPPPRAQIDRPHEMVESATTVRAPQTIAPATPTTDDRRPSPSLELGVIATIPVGKGPVAVAVDPGSHAIYVALKDEKKVSVISAATHTEIGWVTGVGARAIALDPGIQSAYTNSGNGLSLFDPSFASKEVITVRVDFGPSTIPGGSALRGEQTEFGLAADPLARTVYVINNNGTVSRINRDAIRKHKNPKLIADVRHYPIRVGRQPTAVAVDTGSRTVYVAKDEAGALGWGSRRTGSVMVIDASTGKVDAAVGVGKYPRAVAVDQGGRTLYVANYADNTVSVIDTSTLAVSATVPVGACPRAMAMDQASHTLYVANQAHNTVSVIDTTTRVVTATIGVGKQPVGVAVDPASRTAYVTNAEDGTLSVIGATG